MCVVVVGAGLGLLPGVCDWVRGGLCDDLAGVRASGSGWNRGGQVVSGVLRVRWAAIGAAVAVSLGAGGIGIVNATISSGSKAVYVPIEPCRLADTRTGADNVGSRSTPLGARGTHTFRGC